MYQNASLNFGSSGGSTFVEQTLIKDKVTI